MTAPPLRARLASLRVRTLFRDPKNFLGLLGMKMDDNRWKLEETQDLEITSSFPLGLRKCERRNMFFFYAH